MSHAHGKTKHEEDFPVEKVISAWIYKIRRSGLKEFRLNPDFEKFIKIRVLDFSTTNKFHSYKCSATAHEPQQIEKLGKEHKEIILQMFYPF